jgi:hypothetical protein
MCLQCFIVVVVVVVFLPGAVFLRVAVLTVGITSVV